MPNLASRRRQTDGTYLSVNWSDPVNWAHPLNERLVSWCVFPPHFTGGTTLRDIAGRRIFTSNNRENTDWDIPTGAQRIGGWGAAVYGGTDESTEFAAALVTAVPCTFCCDFRCTDITTQQCLVLVQNGDSGSAWFILEAAGHVAGDPIRAQAQGVSAETFATTTTGYTSGQWHHAAGLFASATSRTALIDGGSAGTNADSHTPTSLSRTAFGAFRVTTSFFSPYTGMLDNMRIYDRLLTTAEVNELIELQKNYSAGLFNRRKPVTYFVAAAPVGGNRRRRVLMGAS